MTFPAAYRGLGKPDTNTSKVMMKLTSAALSAPLKEAAH
jgi:hypothetical protein